MTAQRLPGPLTFTTSSTPTRRHRARSPRAKLFASNVVLGLLLVSGSALAAPPMDDMGDDTAEDTDLEDVDAPETDDAEGLDEANDTALDGEDPTPDEGDGMGEGDDTVDDFSGDEDDSFDEPAEAEAEPGAEASAEAEVELEAPERLVDDQKNFPGNLPPRHRLYYLNLVAARYNPLGLEERLWMGYQRRLYSKSDPLWNQSNIAFFGNLLLSPAIARFGATFQYQPLSILRFRATYGYQSWFGTFQYMRSYDSPYVDHSETKLGRDADNGLNYATSGHQVELGGLFQIKVGPIAIRSNTNVYYNAYNLNGQNDVFYDVRIDALVPNNGWNLLNDSDVLYLPDNGLLLGVRATTTKSFFPDRVYEPGEETVDPNGPMFRVGPAIGYQFFDRPGAAFNKPLILLLSQWHVKHRFRTGLDRNQAIPTLALAFKFEGDLWKKRE